VSDPRAEPAADRRADQRVPQATRAEGAVVLLLAPRRAKIAQATSAERADARSDELSLVRELH